MKITRQDFFRLWQPLASSLLILLAGGGSAIRSLEEKQQAQSRLEQVQQANHQAKQKNKRAQEEASAIQHGMNIHQALAKQGLIGDEKRLDWIELLDEIEQAHDIQQMTYVFSPPQRMSIAGTDKSVFAGSRQHLKLKLRHEGEFMAILAQLKSSAKAMLIIRSCRLSRASSDIAHQLAVECEIDWITHPIITERP